MNILFYLLIAISALAYGLGSGANGQNRNQLITYGGLGLILIPLISIFVMTWQYALTILIIGWLSGILLTFYFNKKYSGLDILTSNINAQNSYKKLLKELEKK